MRAEPVLLFQHILDEDRSLLEFLNADYTFLTKLLAGHYGITEAENLLEDEFRAVTLAGGRRGGVLGLGGVLAMTSHYEETSPVLRGAWVLETLLGTPVPTPPPEVPDGFQHPLPVYLSRKKSGPAAGSSSTIGRKCKSRSGPIMPAFR